MITILSIPRSGTRFYFYFVTEVLGLPCEFAHFYNAHLNPIIGCMARGDTIIVPTRSDEAVSKSFSAEHQRWLDEELFVARDFLEPLLVDYGAHFMDIEKSDATVGQFKDLLLELGQEWTPKVIDFIEEWRPIGSQFTPDDERSKTTLDEIVNHRLEGTAQWQS